MPQKDIIGGGGGGKFLGTQFKNVYRFAIYQKMFAITLIFRLKIKFPFFDVYLDVKNKH